MLPFRQPACPEEGHNAGFRITDFFEPSEINLGQYGFRVVNHFLSPQ